MTTSKDDALAIASDPDLVPYDQFCKKIDLAIAYNAGSSDPIRVLTAGVESQTITRALFAYENVGWDCSWRDSATDGPHLKLE